MDHVLYAYLNIICIIILLFILYRISRGSYLSDTHRTFVGVVVSLAIIEALDAVAIMASGVSYAVSVAANSTFLFWTSMVGYRWFRYTEAQLGHAEHSRAGRAVLYLPIIIQAFVCYASIWTGWIFWVDPQTVLYHRGPLHSLQVLLASLYLIASACMIIIDLRKDTSTQRRRELLTLLTFCCLPAIGALLDVAIYGIPFTWTLCTVGAMMVFVNFQEYSISTDSLTGLNNRRLFDSYEESLVKDGDKGAPVFLLLLDVDRFKTINDRFGHRAGDAALVEVAGLLKASAAGKPLMVARYGGDEFTVLGEFENRAAVQAFKQQIIEAFEQRNRQTDAPYSLQVSIGFAELGKDASTASDLVARADAMLYREKAEHEALR